MSTMFTLNVAGADVLFAASFAVQETWVVPTGNVAPEVLLQETVGEGSIASVAVTVKVTGEPLGPAASFVIGPGTTTVGAPRSTTVTVKVAGADVLPEASFAVHETLVVPSRNVDPDPGLQVAVGDGSTRSVALAANVTAAPPGPVAAAVIGAGTLMVGEVLSTTVTVKEAGAEVLFEWSVAVHETVVVPSGKVSPDAWLQEKVGEGSIASAAETENVTTAPPAPVASLEIGPGTDTVGAPWSATVTVKVAGADVLFEWSFAVQETVVAPSGNVDPDAGLQATVGDGSTTSDAVTVNVTLAPLGPVAAAVIGPGTFTVGGVVSTRFTVTVNAAEPVFPLLSVAEQVTGVVPTVKFEPEDGEQLGVIEPETASVADPAP